MGSMEIRKGIDEVTPDIQEKQAILPQEAISLVDDVASIFMDYDLEYTPIGETEELYNQTIIDIDDWLTRTVWSPVPQWDWVIEGTPPHDIYPVNAEALFWPGTAHPVKHVHHPGTVANDFPALAYMDAIGDVEIRCEEFLDKMAG